MYSILLALSQVISTNSYQLTLLAGEVGNTPTRFYVVTSIYLVSTAVWYLLARRFQSIYALTLPFFIYGLAFVLMGSSAFASTDHSQRWAQNVATAFYAIASSSGVVAFAFNFGDESLLYPSSDEL